MKKLTAEQKTNIRSWIKKRKDASYVWINKDGGVNYATAQGSFFAGWAHEIVEEIQREGN